MSDENKYENRKLTRKEGRLSGSGATTYSPQSVKSEAMKLINSGPISLQKYEERGYELTVEDYSPRLLRRIKLPQKKGTVEIKVMIRASEKELPKSLDELVEREQLAIYNRAFEAGKLIATHLMQKEFATFFEKMLGPNLNTFIRRTRRPRRRE